MTSLRQRISYWWRPEYQLFIWMMRLDSGEKSPVVHMGGWLRVVPIGRGHYIISAVYDTPASSYARSALFLLAAAACIAVWVWLDWVGVVLLALLALPFYPRLRDLPDHWLALSVRSDGFVNELTRKGAVRWRLFNFDEGYYLYPQAHQGGIDEERRHQTSVGIAQAWHGFQTEMTAKARARGDWFVSDASPGPFIPPQNPRVYGDASQLFVVKGPRGSEWVKIAEIANDRQCLAANALAAAIELAIERAKADRIPPAQHSAADTQRGAVARPEDEFSPDDDEDEYS